MEKQLDEYTATQTEQGFLVEFHGTEKAPISIDFDDFQDFANKYKHKVEQGSDPDLSEKEELLLSLWKMLLIPDKTVH